MSRLCSNLVGFAKRELLAPGAVADRSKFGVRCSMFDVSRFLLVACLGGGFAACLFAAEPSDFHTISSASEASAADTVSSPAAAPSAPRVRTFTEENLLELLTRTLQQDYLKDNGDIELRLSRPWPSRNVPDGTLTLKILDLPRTGVAPSFLVRIELRSERESLGTWQLAVQARLWREVWVARSPLKRGDRIADADLGRERRDVLALREPLADFAVGEAALELAEPLQPGSPLFVRSVKLRPVIRRGQSADALIQDGTLSITLKVEALEDGAPGQIIRARNTQSRRDIRGKVLNEQTILISL